MPKRRAIPYTPVAHRSTYVQPTLEQQLNFENRPEDLAAVRAKLNRIVQKFEQNV